MEEIIKKAANIKLLICDIDGVLTEGYVYYGEQGEAFKAFHVHDGLGLKLLMMTGVEVGIITTAQTPIVTNRMSILEIKHLYTGQLNKVKAYEDLLTRLALEPSQVAMVGDDLPDLPLIQQSGLGIAVANATSTVKAHADWVTSKPGGHGAVREICDLLMTAQNSNELALQKYQTL